MKNLLTLAMFIFCFSGLNSLNAQSFSPPEPFTQGESNKANAYLGLANYDFLLLWEQSIDTFSTAIYYKYYLDGGEPQLMVSEPGVHFKKPMILNWGTPGDTTFMVMFEKVSNNKTELNYIKFAGDGGHTAPLIFANTGNTNNTLALPGDFYTTLPIAYNSNGHLLTTRIEYNNGIISFANPDTLYSGIISDIQVKMNVLYWISNDSDSARLMMAHEDYQNNWSEPEVVFVAIEMGTFGSANHYADDQVLAFSYKENNQWHINNYTWANGYSDFTPLDIVREDPFDYGVFSTYFGVDDGDLQIYHLAYVDDTLGAQEIFINQEYYSNEYTQLSYLGTTSRNPKFYLGENEYNYGNWGYLIWEAYVNGFWQLYYSRAPFTWGSINENQQIVGVKVSPNPATGLISITNNRELELSYSLYDITGRILIEDVSSEITINLNTYSFKRGVYVLTIRNGGEQSSQKIILE